jgi:hypothetical protein
MLQAAAANKQPVLSVQATRMFALDIWVVYIYILKSSGSLNKDVASYTETHTKHAPRWRGHGRPFAAVLAA